METQWGYDGGHYTTRVIGYQLHGIVHRFQLLNASRGEKADFRRTAFHAVGPEQYLGDESDDET
jgi:hypothetical protein